MKRLLLTFAALCLLTIPLQAQNYFDNVRLTIDSTAGGVSFTASDISGGNGHPQVNSASCVSNSSGGDFRFTVDGSAPTDSLGVLVAAGSRLDFVNSTQGLLGFKAIRTDSTSAVLECTFSNGITPPVIPGATGSGGAAATVVVTQGTSPWVVSGTVTADAGAGWGTDAEHGADVIADGPQIMLGATSTYQTAVTTGKATRPASGLDGIQIMRPNAHVGDFIKGVAAVTDGSSTSLVASQGAGVRFCATTLIVSNSSATNVTVDIRDGTAGSVIATIPASANMGGAVISLPVPLCTTAATAMAVDPSAAASTVTTTAIGFRTAQ